MATHDEWYSKYERERQERKAEAKNALLNLAEPLTAATWSDFSTAAVMTAASEQ